MSVKFVNIELVLENQISKNNNSLLSLKKLV